MVIATTDWATIATFATAIGTLVLAVATFAAVRSANLSARVAERSFQVNLRPVLVPSRIDDLAQKIRWQDDHWARLEGNQTIIEFIDGSIYLAISVRNVGAGLAVTFGWNVMTELATGATPHADPEQFRMQTRDLYTPAGDIGFWQGAIRDASDPDYAAAEQGHQRGAAVHDRRALRRPRGRAAHHHQVRDIPPPRRRRHEVVPFGLPPLEPDRPDPR